MSRSVAPHHALRRSCGCSFETNRAQGRWWACPKLDHHLPGRCERNRWCAIPSSRPSLLCRRRAGKRRCKIVRREQARQKRHNLTRQKRKFLVEIRSGSSAPHW